MMMINPSQQIRDLDWKAVGLASLGIATGFAFYFLYRQGKEIISLKGRLSDLENQEARSLNERTRIQSKLGDLDQRVQNLEQIQAQLREEQTVVQRGHQTLRQEFHSQQQSLAQLNQRLDRGQDVVNRLSRQVGALGRDLTELTSDQEEIRSRFDEHQISTENQIRGISHLVSGQSVSSYPLSSMSNRESTSFSYPIIGQRSLTSRFIMRSWQPLIWSNSSNTIPRSLRENSSSHLTNLGSVSHLTNLGSVDPLLGMFGVVGSNLLRRASK